MPIYNQGNGKVYNPPDLIRYVHLISGKPKFGIKYQPKVNYAIGETKSVIEDEYIKSYNLSGQYESIYLYSTFCYKSIIQEDAIELTEDGFFYLSYNEKLRVPTKDMVNAVVLMITE